MKQLEARNIASVRNLANSFTSCATRDEVETFLDRLQLDKGIVLSAGQRSHVINELTGSHGVAITQGDPGTGKTFASEIVEKFVKEVLIPTGRGHFTINVAFTGKAALEMQEASGRQAFTIDSFLNSYHSGKILINSTQPIDQVNTVSLLNSGSLHINSGQQVVIKVDEASFVGARQAEHLLKIVKDFQAQGIQSKILFIGDLLEHDIYLFFVSKKTGAAILHLASSLPPSKLSSAAPIIKIPHCKNRLPRTGPPNFFVCILITADALSRPLPAFQSVIQRCSFCLLGFRTCRLCPTLSFVPLSEVKGRRKLKEQGHNTKYRTSKNESLRAKGAREI